MQDCNNLLQQLKAGNMDEALSRVYDVHDGGKSVEQGRSRSIHVTEEFIKLFGNREGAGLYTGPGRTEICGNHTDHQRGRVLAAAVNLDFLVCAAPNGTNTIRFMSEGWHMVEVNLDNLEPVEEEKEGTAALVRGVAAGIAQRGYKPVGFDAYATSMVLPGSGLSSSAACEVTIGVILNHMVCGDELDAVTIAQIGQYAENVFFGKPCGLMDQTASSVGGAVAIDFADTANPVVHPIEVDLAGYGYALCIIDSGADHADLTAEYAAIPQEMKAVAAHFGCEVQREVDPSRIWTDMPALREKVGDRAVLRALHFFADDARVAQEADALERGDFDTFLKLVQQSGESSWMYLQNIAPVGAVREQAMAVALATAAHALQGRGAYRVHGGGFAGTIQAFVPLDMLEQFKAQVEEVLGQGSCHVLAVRGVGGAVVCE